MQKIISKKIEKSYNSNGEIVISFTVENENKEVAESMYEALKDVEHLSFKAKKEYGKRTGKQNKMFWALIDKISFAVHGNNRKSSIDEVYSSILKEANQSHEFIWIEEEKIEELKKEFRIIVDTKYEKTIEGKKYKLFDCFQGTSQMDVLEMMELIETTLDKIAFLGIDDNETNEIKRNVSNMKTKMKEFSEND